MSPTCHTNGSPIGQCKLADPILGDQAQQGHSQLLLLYCHLADHIQGFGSRGQVFTHKGAPCSCNSSTSHISRWPAQLQMPRSPHVEDVL